MLSFIGHVDAEQSRLLGDIAGKQLAHFCGASAGVKTDDRRPAG